MKVLETELKGAFIVEPEFIIDERGFFARIWCKREFEAKGIVVNWVQSNISGNLRKGTLRGMHYQLAPHAEIKLVRCTVGRIYDVIIDLRPDSSTYLKHISVELSSRNHKMLFVPKYFAHGFQTLEDDSEVMYLMSEYFSPECARGVRWNDPLFRIEWPADTRLISQRDASYPDHEVVAGYPGQMGPEV